MDTIDKIKKLTAADDTELILLLVENTANRIKSYCGFEILPIELEWLLIELTVSRFNKLGSEGMGSESIEGLNRNFEDPLLEYKTILDTYKINTADFI